MPNALESKLSCANVTRKASLRKDRAPEPFCRVKPDRPQDAAVSIVARIKAIRRAQGGGSYLFIDTDMNAYVVSESQSIALVWLRERFAWVVGCYLPRKPSQLTATLVSGYRDTKEGLTVTVAGIAEDMVEHLADLRRTKA